MSLYECNQCQATFEQEESCGCACSCEAPKCPKCDSTDIKQLSDADRMRKLFGNMKLGGG